MGPVGLLSGLRGGVAEGLGRDVCGDLWSSQEAGRPSGAREMSPRALTLAPSPAENHSVEEE